MKASSIRGALNPWKWSRAVVSPLEKCWLERGYGLKSRNGSFYAICADWEECVCLQKTSEERDQKGREDFRPDFRTGGPEEIQQARLILWNTSSLHFVNNNDTLDLPVSSPKCQPFFGPFLVFPDSGFLTLLYIRVTFFTSSLENMWLPLLSRQKNASPAPLFFLLFSSFLPTETRWTVSFYS